MQISPHKAIVTTYPKYVNTLQLCWKQQICEITYLFIAAFTYIYTTLYEKETKFITTITKSIIAYFNILCFLNVLKTKVRIMWRVRKKEI